MMENRRHGHGQAKRLGWFEAGGQSNRVIGKSGQASPGRRDCLSGQLSSATVWLWIPSHGGGQIGICEFLTSGHSQQKPFAFRHFYQNTEDSSSGSKSILTQHQHPLLGTRQTTPSKQNPSRICPSPRIVIDPILSPSRKKKRTSYARSDHPPAHLLQFRTCKQQSAFDLTPSPPRPLVQRAPTLANLLLSCESSISLDCRACPPTRCNPHPPLLPTDDTS